jgi:hypothetical protein
LSGLRVLGCVTEKYRVRLLGHPGITLKPPEVFLQPPQAGA